MQWLRCEARRHLVNYFTPPTTTYIPLQTPSTTTCGNTEFSRLPTPALRRGSGSLQIAEDSIFYPDQNFFIWKMSFLSLFSAAYAYLNGHYDLALVPGGIFITSINYWRNPLYSSWRRTLDINYVRIGLTYQLIRAYNSQYYKLYYPVIFTSLIFYPISFYYYDKKLYWRSAYAHSMLHILANVSNIILYSGKVNWSAHA